MRRRNPPKPKTNRNCLGCGQDFISARAEFCSDNCRKRYWDKKNWVSIPRKEFEKTAKAKDLEWKKRIEQKIDEEGFIEKIIKLADIEENDNLELFDDEVLTNKQALHHHSADIIVLVLEQLKKSPLIEAEKDGEVWKKRIEKLESRIRKDNYVFEQVEKSMPDFIPRKKIDDIIPTMNDIYATDDECWTEIRKDLLKVIKGLLDCSTKTKFRIEKTNLKDYDNSASKFVLSELDCSSKSEEKIIWCNCGDSTKNKDGVCDTCKLIDAKPSGLIGDWEKESHLYSETEGTKLIGIWTVKDGLQKAINEVRLKWMGSYPNANRVTDDIEQKIFGSGKKEVKE